MILRGADVQLAAETIDVSAGVTLPVPRDIVRAGGACIRDQRPHAPSGDVIDDEPHGLPLR